PIRKRIGSGFGIKDAYGNVVKEAAEGGSRFVNVEGNVNTANTSALPELDELASSKIYPNPVVNDLNVELSFSENIDFRLTVLNAYGQMVKDLGNQNGNTYSRTIDVSDLSAGMYLVSVLTEEGQRTFKFNKL
ncbi:MAG: T9SS C-terminal target domain-containing protein, partial [Chitinophagia bacterium]|nr:T9SS C-terminal target domain-containing protein [Chitinophagia bacterium]